MGVCGTKIALIVGSIDLDMPPCPLSHRGGFYHRLRGFSTEATASLIPILDE
jgi:hypothetical protein